MSKLAVRPTSSDPAPELQLAPVDYTAVRALVGGLGLAEPVAATLVRRGYASVEAARAFLDAGEEHDPFEFAAMAEVTRRLRAACAAGRRITVHGDYDVDGVCSTAILVRCLRELGGEVDWLIPDRLADGYGLTASSVEAIAHRGSALLITTDCGIGSAAEVEIARAAGLEVIVTDHHQPGGELPDCPILHPVVSGYPCADLCATGVAYKLACALLGPEAARGELDLVALATVADLVPLLGENRTLVRRGLAEARRAQRPGLRALIASAGVRAESLDEGDLGFRLAPRINAAGRLYRADAGVELMLTRDEPRATAIAAELDRANRERRAVEDQVLRDAERAHRELPPELAEAAGLVLAGEGWHPGVVGIVASRLAERLARPVVLVGLDQAGRGRGSGRSVPGVDLLGALDSCAEHLLRHGGHRAAAGLELEAARLDDFRRAFADCIAARLAEAEGGGEALDAVVGGESLGHDVAEQLARLAPFGKGNPAVRWLVPAAQLGDVRRMGEGERHARFSIRSGPRSARGVAFGAGGELDALAGEPVDVSIRLELNEWNGAVEPRVVLGTIHRAADSDETAGSEATAALAVGDDEYWARLEAELARPLTGPPVAPGAGDATQPAAGAPHRVEVERGRCSGIATVAALAAGGETVLVIAADAWRRRALVERAVRPARFGGGETALAPGAASRAGCRAAIERVLEAGCGVTLADWAALAADPELARGFAHVVIVDPAPCAELAHAARAGSGYLHDLGAGADLDLALRVLGEEWPSRETLAFCLRGLLRAGAGDRPLAGPAAREALDGPGRAYPRSPEVAGRLLRVLGELGLVEVRGSRAGRELAALRFVPEGVDPQAGGRAPGKIELERSAAYNAYRERHEEGRRYLSGLKRS